MLSLVVAQHNIPDSQLREAELAPQCPDHRAWSLNQRLVSSSRAQESATSATDLL